MVACPGGGWRLYYTAVGPGKPFEACQVHHHQRPGGLYLSAAIHTTDGSMHERWTPAHFTHTLITLSRLVWVAGLHPVSVLGGWSGVREGGWYTVGPAARGAARLTPAAGPVGGPSSPPDSPRANDGPADVRRVTRRRHRPDCHHQVTAPPTPLVDLLAQSRECRGRVENAESRVLSERTPCWPCWPCSAWSADGLHWTHEEGIRLQSDQLSLRCPRACTLASSALRSAPLWFIPQSTSTQHRATAID